MHHACTRTIVGACMKSFFLNSCSEILQGLPDQERQQLTEQLAQTEREKVSYVLCVYVVAINTFVYMW